MTRTETGFSCTICYARIVGRKFELRMPIAFVVYYLTISKNIGIFLVYFECYQHIISVEALNNLRTLF